jgi:hypothetical protein
MKKTLPENSTLEYWYSKIITIVYVYAGLAKLNSDWLLEAMPLKFGYPIIPIFH